MWICDSVRDLRALTAPQCPIMDLYRGQSVTAKGELSLHLETGRVPLQNRPVTAARICLLTGRDSSFTDTGSTRVLGFNFNRDRQVSTCHVELWDPSWVQSLPVCVLSAVCCRTCWECQWCRLRSPESQSTPDPGPIPAYSSTEKMWISVWFKTVT